MIEFVTHLSMTEFVPCMTWKSSWHICRMLILTRQEPVLRPCVTHCNTLQYIATHYSQGRSQCRGHVQHTATHCNTLQHTATHYSQGRSQCWGHGPWGKWRPCHRQWWSYRTCPWATLSHRSSTTLWSPPRLLRTAASGRPPKCVCVFVCLCVCVYTFYTMYSQCRWSSQAPVIHEHTLTHTHTHVHPSRCTSIQYSLNTGAHTHTYTDIQPIAFGVSFLQSQISIDVVAL